MSSSSPPECTKSVRFYYCPRPPSPVRELRIPFFPSRLVCESVFARRRIQLQSKRRASDNRIIVDVGVLFSYLSSVHGRKRSLRPIRGTVCPNATIRRSLASNSKRKQLGNPYASITVVLLLANYVYLFFRLVSSVNRQIQLQSKRRASDNC